jgi:hypothetical protein
MADRVVEGKEKQVTGRYGVLEKITSDGSEREPSVSCSK